MHGWRRKSSTARRHLKHRGTEAPDWRTKIAVGICACSGCRERFGVIFAVLLHRYSVRWLLSVVLAGSAVLVGFATEQQPAPEDTPGTAMDSAPQLTLSARELVHGMQRAIAVMLKAQNETNTAPAEPTRRSVALSESLARCTQATDQLLEALAPGGRDPYEALRRCGSAVAALQVCQRYSGNKAESVDHAFLTLVARTGILRRNYGRDLVAARSEAEAALNPVQKTALDSLKNRGAECAKGLEKIRPQVGHNPAIAFECEAMSRELARVNAASRNRSALQDALTTAEIFLGRWEGTRRYAEWVYPGDVPALSGLDEAVQAFDGALTGTTRAAYTESDAQVFAQPAHFTEDIAVTDLADAEAQRLLQTLRSAPTPSRDRTLPPSTRESMAADKATDRQINADDPDDDTSLDSGDDEEAAASAERAGGSPP
jgi:hypothetical protein